VDLVLADQLLEGGFTLLGPSPPRDPLAWRGTAPVV